MPGVVMMKDGVCFPVMSAEDLAYIARIYAGDEFADLLGEYITSLDEDYAYAEAEVKELHEDLEQAHDFYRSLLLSIREEADALEDLLDQPRLNRKAITEGIRNIWKMVSDEL